MLAHGHTFELLADLVRGGRASVTAGAWSRARAIEVARMRITEAGRHALAGTR